MQNHYKLWFRIQWTTR